MLANLREKEGLSFEIEVDGGINEETIIDCVNAGANVIVAGSYVFDSGDVSKSIEVLRSKVQSLSNNFCTSC